MEHVPLAIFVNGLLSAFNELRHCAPLSLASALATILQVDVCGTHIHQRHPVVISTAQAEQQSSFAYHNAFMEQQYAYSGAT